MKFQWKFTDKSFRNAMIQNTPAGEYWEHNSAAVFQTLNKCWNQTFLSQVSSFMSGLQSNLSKLLFQGKPEQSSAVQ